MKRKLCRPSSGRNASARCRCRSAGQMYLKATIPHATKLNAMLTKKQICGSMNVSLVGIPGCCPAHGGTIWYHLAKILYHAGPMSRGKHRGDPNFRFSFQTDEMRQSSLRGAKRRKIGR